VKLSPFDQTSKPIRIATLTCSLKPQRPSSSAQVKTSITPFPKTKNSRVATKNNPKDDYAQPFTASSNIQVRNFNTAHDLAFSDTLNPQ
jgi:hypothetical protein